MERKKKFYKKSVLVFISIFLIVCTVDFIIYILLHTSWINNMESVLGGEKVAAMGYKKGIFPNAVFDTSFSEFAASYIVLSLISSLVLSISGTLFYLYINKKAASEEINTVKKLDQLITGKTVTSTLSDSLLEEKMHQVITAYQKKDSDIAREQENINKLINDISHQIKTPLSSVSIYTELIRDGNITDDERNEFIQQIEAQTEKIKLLFDSLIKIARLENNLIEIKKERADIISTVKSAVNDVRAKADMKNISFEFEPEMPQYMITHDILWTKEAFVNILDNAVKYSYENSAIRILMETGAVHIGIKIINRGIGVNKGEINNIFTRFYRSQKALETNIAGSGLGLNIAREILIKQYGYITVDVSDINPDEVTFCVFLQNC